MNALNVDMKGVGEIGEVRKIKRQQERKREIWREQVR